MAGRFALRRVDEAERAAVEEEADGDAGLAEEPFEPGVRAGAPAGVVGRRTIEVDVGADDGDEGEPGGGVRSRNGVRRRQAVFVVGERDGELRRQFRTAGRACQQAVGPLEDLARQGREIERCLGQFA